MQPLSFILTHAWLIPVIPLVSFLLVGLVLRPISERLAGAFATLAVGTSALLSWTLAYDYVHLAEHGKPLPSLLPWAAMWLHFQDGFGISIVMLSGRDDQLAKSMAYDVGADDYLTKPCDWFRLVDVITRHAAAHP